MSERFWMVYGVGQRGPTFRHYTERGARVEAERLARLSPGTTFVVLEAISAHTLPLPPVEVTELRPAGADVVAPADESDENPF